MDLPFTALGLGAVLVLSAIFSTAEALLNKINRGEVKETVEEGGLRAEAITDLLQKPQNFLNTIMVARGCLSVGVVILSIMLVNLLRVRDGNGTPVANFGIAAAVSAVLLIVFTEMAPKSYVKGKTERSFVKAIFFLRIFYVLLYPIIKLLAFASYISVRLVGGKANMDEGALTSQADLEALTAVSESEDILEEEERDMIHGIFELESTVAREIMTPRTDMIYLDVATDLKDVLATVVEKGHSRIPVYEDNIDNVVGILHVKDLLRCWYEYKQDVRLEDLLRPPLLVPETKGIDDLLQEFRAARTHMAIVLDEYGGTAGLVTIEDIIEEIVGEIQDEYDQEDGLVEELEDGIYQLDARIPIDEVNDLLAITLPSEDSDSIGGFIVNYLGRVPQIGESFSYDSVRPSDTNGNGGSNKDLQFSIIESDERRISRVEVRLLGSNQ
ncbi:hemolysin family protein [Candidatus Poribacteria bacterium]